jgi:hypothetical protein
LGKGELLSFPPGGRDGFPLGGGAGRLFLLEQIDSAEHSALPVVKLEDPHFHKPHRHEIGDAIRPGQIAPLSKENGFLKDGFLPKALEKIYLKRA